MKSNPAISTTLTPTTRRDYDTTRLDYDHGETRLQTMTTRKLKVAILDDYHNLSPAIFSPLSAQIDLSYYASTLNPHDATHRDALIQRLHPYEAIVTMRERTPFPADLVSQLPNLRLLLTQGTRNLALDLPALSAHGVTVTGTTGRPPEAVVVPSTVQHTWGLVLALAREIPRDDARLKTNPQAWQGRPLAMNLAGKTLGILGLGKLGAETARIGVQAFGMRVVAWSANLTQQRADHQAVRMGLEPGVFDVAASKQALFEAADVVSVHCVLSDRSRGVVGRDELARMKPSALLVNTSRGPLVDEQALLECLHAGRIRGAALDVFDREPLPAASPWRSTPWGTAGRSQVVLSPHMGYGEEEQIQGWYRECADNLRRWLAGEEVMRLN